MSDSPRRLFNWRVEARHPDACAHPEGVREHARAAMRVDRDHVRRVLAAGRLSVERVHESQHAFRRRQPADARELAEAAPGPPTDRRVSPRVDPGTHDQRLAPNRAVRREVFRVEDDAVHLEKRSRRAILGRQLAAPFLSKRLEGLHQAGLVEELACSKRAPVAREDLRTALQREELAEHLERRSVHLGKRNALGARAPERGSHSRFHGSRPSRSGELTQRRGKARHGARRGTDRVHDGLVAEGDRELGELADADGIAAKPSRFRTLVPSNTMAWHPDEQPAHHRLGDAGGERHRDHGVGGGAAVDEDLETHLGRRRMTRRNSRPHGRHALIAASCQCAPAAKRPTSGVSARPESAQADSGLVQLPSAVDRVRAVRP